MNVLTIKNNFVKDVKELLKEKLKENLVVKVSNSVADGREDYMLKNDGFYIGGGYAKFAGEYLEDMYMKKSSKLGVFGDYSFGHSYYDVKYDLETFFDNLDYELAAKILAEINN